MVYSTADQSAHLYTLPPRPPPCCSSHVGYRGIYTCVPDMDEDRQTVPFEQFKKVLANSNKHVFSPADITSLILQVRAEYPFPRSLSERKFQKSLIDSGVLKEISLTASHSFETTR